MDPLRGAAYNVAPSHWTPQASRVDNSRKVPLRFIGRPNTMGIFGKTVTTDRMKTRLPIIPLLVVIALAAGIIYFLLQNSNTGKLEGIQSNNPGKIAPIDTESVKQANEILDQAVQALREYNSLAAGMQYQANLFGHQISGSGEYSEQRSEPFPKVCLKIAMPLGDRVGALVEVCDGQRYLWTYRRLLDQEKLTRIDLSYVAKATANSKPARPISRLTGTVGLGGLAGLVRELRRNFRFEVAGQTSFSGEPAVQLRGQWLPKPLAKVLPEQKEAILQGKEADLTKLPRHLPHEVIVTLGQDNKLLYRVEYRRFADKKDSSLSSAGEGNVVLEWYNISRNNPIAPGTFEYHPGDITISDRTQSFLDELKDRDN